MQTHVIEMFAITTFEKRNFFTASNGSIKESVKDNFCKRIKEYHIYHSSH